MYLLCKPDNPCLIHQNHVKVEENQLPSCLLPNIHAKWHVPTRTNTHTHTHTVKLNFQKAQPLKRVISVII